MRTVGKVFPKPIPEPASKPEKEKPGKAPAEKKD